MTNSAADRSGDARTRSAWRRRLFAVGASLLVVFVLPELLLRWFGPDTSAYRAIRFGGDANSERLFVKDRDLQWALRANARLPFLGVEVQTDAQGFRVAGDRELGSGDGCCVLCVGDSTTFGWGVAGDETFPARLEAALRRRQPERHWSVHNAGVPGYSSEQVRRAAARWIPRLQPEVVVVCVGNNDAWPARTSDRQALAPGLARSIVDVLSRSALLSWAAGSLRGSAAENPIYFADDAVPRVSEGEMVENLTAIIDLARRHDARVVVLGAPANLHFPPRNVDDEIQRNRALGDNIYAEIQRGRVDAARKLAAEALAGDPDSIYFQWLDAMITALAVDPARGRDELEAVFERHPYPDRARRSYRQRQGAVAAAAGIPFADVNELFLSGRSAEAARQLYLDWCHPTSEGHRLMAMRLLTWIAE
ncbi:MAG TPA: hypothetical protein ENI87_09210 [bacterium]|nr:hypothetical protein [bacterium]